MAKSPARLQWYGWLRALLSSWLSAKVIPAKNILAEIGIDPLKPVCYVLRSNSIFDLLALDIYCQRLGLPRPYASIDELGSTSDASTVYLSKVGLLRTYGAYRHEPPSPFVKAFQRISEEPDFDVQMVPVSVFWGRDPGHAGKSLWKLFFPDDERAGFFQKAAIVFAHGRNALISFSRPVGLRQELKDVGQIQETARKLTRVIRVHFQHKRTATLGPGLINRNRVIETLVRGKHLRSAIEDEAKKKGISRDRAERLAKEYISEIAAEVTPQVIQGFSILLRRLWRRMYNQVIAEHVERVRQIPANAEIVYVPCHRSHIDYLIVNYVLYEQGLVTPHVAAGVNLNFWPIGSLLRRFGAFYIRRTFNNNRLYAVVFSEYVAFLLQRGSPLQFFLEGGRSRTGKLLPPKTGMVAMVIQSYLRNSDRPIFFVPVYIGYDSVMEVKSYRRELTGAKKQAESVGQLVKTRKALNRKHGNAYIGFGQPIELGGYISGRRADWRNDAYTLDSKPAWLPSIVHDIAEDIIKEINKNVVVGSAGIVSLVLNASRTKAMAEEDLILHINYFTRILRESPYSESLKIREGSAKELVVEAERFMTMNRFHHSGGDVLHLQEPQASYSIYARNNIAHAFALQSLVAFFLQHNDHIDESFVIKGVKLIYPIIEQEFFLHWPLTKIESVVADIIETFVRIGLFQRDVGGRLLRPEVSAREFTILRTLGLVVGAAIERYSVAVGLLHQYEGSAFFSLEDFQSQCVQMAQRISLLTGVTDGELPSAALFKIIVEHLIDSGYVEKGPEGLRLTPSFVQAYEVTSALLSADIRSSMSRARK
jgi:glycerol-3-phosphate O-acyltransferase